MKKKYVKAISTALLALLATMQQANAGTISILDDRTSAQAFTTFFQNAGGVLDGGTTLQRFDGALFPGGVFGGSFSLDGDRTAHSEFDEETYTARNYLLQTTNEGYVNQGILGSGCCTFISGAQGAAAATTSMYLKFSVSGSDSSMDLHAEANGSPQVSLSLFDITLDTKVVDLNPQPGVQRVNDFELLDGHTYLMVGNMRVQTQLGGDPYAELHFWFDNSDIVTADEPASFLFVVLGLVICLLRRSPLARRSDPELVTDAG